MTMSNLTPSIHWLLQPVTFATFAETIWEKQHLNIKRDDPTFYRRLLSDEALDSALASAARANDGIELLSPSNRSLVVHDPRIVLGAVKDGQSFRINAIHRFVPAIEQLKASIEQVIGFPINVNMYLTPGSGRALGRHFDTHDVFVLQVTGSKVWRLFDKPVVSPLEYLPVLRGETRQDLKRHRLPKTLKGALDTTLDEQFVHHAGDFLYLPRGVWHEAEGQADSISCHLTMGIRAVTYSELMALVFGNLANRMSLLRQSLPLGSTTSKDSRQHVAKQVEAIVTSIDLQRDSDEALAAAGGIFIRSRKSAISTRLLSYPASRGSLLISQSGRYKVPDHLIVGIRLDNDCVWLRWLSEEVSFPISFKEACWSLISKREIIPREIQGFFTETDKAAFVSKLINAGLLVQRDTNVRPDTSFRGWLPIHLTKTKHEVRWLKYGVDALEDVFFHYTVKRLIRDAAASIRTTTLSDLATVPLEIRPAGFIFHLSRCGSTLLSNAMRALGGTRVIAEPAIVNGVLTASNYVRGKNSLSQNMALESLRGVVRSFGLRLYSEQTSSLIFKFTSWNILHLEIFRKIWPDVPCVVITRNPAEILASCLANEPGWMKERSYPRLAEMKYGIPRSRNRDMMPDEYGALVLAKFIGEVAKHNGPLCKVLDYKALSPEAVRQVAGSFGIAPGEAEMAKAIESMKIYSKDNTRTTVYSGESDERVLVSRSLESRDCILEAVRAYDSLMKAAVRVGASARSAEAGEECITR